MHMLHHFSIAVADISRSAMFYDAVLSSLGYVRVWTDQTAIGYGLPGGDDKFAIKLRGELSYQATVFISLSQPTRGRRLQRFIEQH